jgi:hypothetical protein
MSSLRTLDDRRDASGFRRTPLLVVADSTDHEHVSRMYDCGGDAYMAKPLAGRLTILRDKITTCLLRAGRVDHARCAEHALLAVRARTGGPVRVSIDGSTSGRRTAVVINDVRRTIQDAKFAVFIRLTAFHVRTPGVWSSRDALGVQGSREALSRIRVQFRGLIPKGFQVIEGDGSRRFRLNTAIVVEHVAWERLADHANAIVRKTAREMLERAAKK